MCGSLCLQSPASLCLFVETLTILLPAIQETWVWSLRWEDHLKKGMAINSGILTWRVPRTGSWQVTVHGVAKNWHDWMTFTNRSSWFYSTSSDVLFPTSKGLPFISYASNFYLPYSLSHYCTYFMCPGIAMWQTRIQVHVLFLSFFLCVAVLPGLWHLSSLTSDQTLSLGSESSES